MQIIKQNNGDKITLKLVGRLDTTTAPELDAELDTVLGNTAELELDFAELEYISSAGLRVLLKAQKAMNTSGKLVLINVGESIMEVFDITGFVDILNIQ